MKVSNWVKKEIYRNPLFSYDYVGFIFDRDPMFSTLNKLDKSYLLEWTFVNVAEGFDELITQAPNNISESLADKYKIFYKDKLFPLYKKRKNAFSFHYGENMSYSDTSDVDITSKAFGANDNFIDDSSSELDKIYSF